MKQRDKTKWKPPPENVLKINVDGSTKDSGISALGIVIRNHKSEIVNYHVENCGVSTALKTEALTVRDCLVLAKKLKLEKIIVESDNLTVVNSINGIWKCPWDIEIIISYILLLMTDFRTIQVSHIFREANVVADCLAKLCHNHSPGSMMDHPEFRALVRKDAIG